MTEPQKCTSIIWVQIWLTLSHSRNICRSDMSSQACKTTFCQTANPKSLAEQGEVEQNKGVRVKLECRASGKSAHLLRLGDLRWVLVMACGGTTTTVWEIPPKKSRLILCWNFKASSREKVSLREQIIIVLKEHSYYLPWLSFHCGSTMTPLPLLWPISVTLY